MMFEELLTGRNVSLAGGIFVCLSMAKKMAPAFFKARVGQRVLPVLPIILGEIGAFINLSDAVKWQDKLLVGLIAGWAAGNVFKVGKTSLLGYGLPDKEDDSEDPVPSSPTLADAPVTTVPAVTSTPDAAIVPDTASKKE